MTIDVAICIRFLVIESFVPEMMYMMHRLSSPNMNCNHILSHHYEPSDPTDPTPVCHYRKLSQHLISWANASNHDHDLSVIVKERKKCQPQKPETPMSHPLQPQRKEELKSIVIVNLQL